MAVPVINPTSNVQGHKQWQYWEYQPWATNNPTSWSASSLPAGISINAATGKIYGAAEVAGFSNVGLTATNADGDSTPLVLSIGIEAAPATLTSSGYEIEIDVTTREVSLVGSGELSLFGKENDDLVIFARFRKGEAYLDLNLSALTLAIKEFDPDIVLVISDIWKKFGSGASAHYGLHAKLEGGKLKGALGNYEADAETAFDGKAEIEWKENNAEADFGPSTFRMSTRHFPLRIARDIAQAA